MSFEQIINLIFSISIWSVAKLLVVFSLLLYILFAFIVLKQVKFMLKTLIVPIELPVKLFAFLHLGLAIFLFFLAVIIL